MNPVKIDIIEKKSAIIAREIKLLTRIEKTPVTRESDELIQHALCHSMQNAIAAVIDLAQHIVAEKSSAIPESYSECILELSTLGIIPKDFAQDFSRVAKLRNVLVHLYDNVDIEFLFSLLPRFKSDLKKFLRCLGEQQF
jgi:uncharacterized protein YutE (UPF0331/DUF86 family)